MGCYCSEISRCRADIVEIMYMRAKLKNADAINHQTISRQITQIAEKLGCTSLPDNLSDTQYGISIANEPIGCSICNLISTCDIKLEQLERELSSMIAADAIYHESLD